MTPRSYLVSHRPAIARWRLWAAALACATCGLAQADIVPLAGNPPLTNCPIPGLTYACVVEGQAAVAGPTFAPIEKVRIARIAGYSNRAELQIGAGASLGLNSVASVVDGYADLVVGDNFGTAGSLIVRDGGQLSITGTATNQGGLIVGAFNAPSDTPLGLSGIPLPSTIMVIKDGGAVSVDRPGASVLASASVSVGRGLGSRSSLVMDGGIGNFGSEALGATLNTHAGYVSVGREGIGSIDMLRNATLQAPLTFMSVVSNQGLSALTVGTRSVVTGEVVAGIGLTPGTLQFNPTSTDHGTANILVQSEGRINGMVTLGRGGTLRGSGNVFGVNNQGGFVSPGNSPGTLNIGAGGYTDVGGHLIIEFGTSGSDRLLVDGAISLDGTEVEFRFIEGFAPAAGFAFDFLDGADALPLQLNNVHYSFSGLESGFQFGVAPGLDGKLVFTALNAGVSAVPEPASWALVAAGLLGLAGWRRRQAAAAVRRG